MTLTELFNERKEMFEYERVADTFERCASQSPQEIVDYLARTADHWRGGCAPNDDITFVVIKRT